MRSYARWVVVAACLSSTAAMADGWPERVLSHATHKPAEQLQLTTRDEVVAPDNGVRIVDEHPADATTW
ncbi:hypothetical protein [Burkholderia ubonensis]|uniref:hypothetical protein n=1 Tax=Burkholderia ubonensis TaxID=101571 RepID=UPI000BA6C7E6|nr:hypothetical protein [Burkholderia ubonensis]PAK13846.1 hypothetical protein CJO66_12735 [Burkholderia ubonensis]RQP38527.1 hypothetical protein DF156_19320 [Burkholderia ubonensis]RQP39527.1 hypothetical protein DF155_06985 [Burkholderia ubonensis]RQP39826.1 hypothetical protein DF154_14760 [Burkholderia ubonensis]RQP52889.1 hypothetical protein DF144_17865 [Burkholderia ubonensis]